MWFLAWKKKFWCIRLHFTFMSKSTPMTSVKVETKSDFLQQEQKCIDFFWTTTGHVYFSDTVGHTSLLRYMYVACQCNDHNFSVPLFCKISFDQKKKIDKRTSNKSVIDSTCLSELNQTVFCIRAWELSLLSWTLWTLWTHDIPA